MNKKDYEKAVEIVKDERIPGFVKMTAETRLEIACAFAHFFKRDSPKFNPHEFFKACGVNVTDI